MYKYGNYINLYNWQKRHETHSPFPNTRFHPDGGRGDTTHGLPKENGALESTPEENDVPDILPHHRLPGTIRQDHDRHRRKNRLDMESRHDKKDTFFCSEITMNYGGGHFSLYNITKILKTPNSLYNITKW
jgi:hypothetical protein